MLTDLSNFVPPSGSGIRGPPSATAMQATFLYGDSRSGYPLTKIKNKNQIKLKIKIK